MPFCTRKDMETVASMLSETGKVLLQHEENKLSALSSVSSASIATVPENRESSPEVISFERHRKESKAVRQPGFDPRQLTVEMIQEQLQRQRAQGIHLTQAEVARRAGMSQSYLSRILNGQCPLNARHKQKLYEILFDKKQGEPPNRSWFSFRPFGLKKAAVF